MFLISLKRFIDVYNLNFAVQLIAKGSFPQAMWIWRFR
jgi:hypothetical protein